MKNKIKLNVSHWVQGETWDKQRIHGYVINAENPEGVAKVYIVGSVNEELPGRMIRVFSESLQTLPEQAPAKAALEQLIDLALLTKDKDWFDQLSKQLYETEVRYL